MSKDRMSLEDLAEMLIELREMIQNLGEEMNAGQTEILEEVKQQGEWMRELEFEEDEDA